MDNMTKKTAVKKMYGSPSFSSGPKAGTGPQDVIVNHNGAGTFKTGPNMVSGKVGHPKAGSVPSTGTKTAQKGMTQAGSASGKRGNVKA